MTPEQANAVMRHILDGEDPPEGVSPEQIEKIRAEIEEMQAQGHAVSPLDEWHGAE